jgi:hypothetical protein
VRLRSLVGRTSNTIFAFASDSEGVTMKKTKSFFETGEMNRLAAVVADCAKAFEERGLAVDDARREEITKSVLQIASRGIIDPDEIRELMVDRLRS